MKKIKKKKHRDYEAIRVLRRQRGAAFAAGFFIGLPVAVLLALIVFGGFYP